MVITTLSDGLNDIIDKAGKPIRIRYYLASAGSVWDDEVTLTELTGSQLWISGVVLPVDTRDVFGSEDLNLLEQGKIGPQDQKIYVHGSLFFEGVGSNISVKIGMTGSPTQTNNYSIIYGGIPYEVAGTKIYKKVYIRKLTNGSLIGET